MLACSQQPTQHSIKSEFHTSQRYLWGYAVSGAGLLLYLELACCCVWSWPAALPLPPCHLLPLLQPLLVKACHTNLEAFPPSVLTFSSSSVVANALSVTLVHELACFSSTLASRDTMNKSFPCLPLSRCSQRAGCHAGPRACMLLLLSPLRHCCRRSWQQTGHTPRPHLSRWQQRRSGSWGSSPLRK